MLLKPALSVVITSKKSKERLTLAIYTKVTMNCNKVSASSTMPILHQEETIKIQLDLTFKIELFCPSKHLLFLSFQILHKLP